MQNIPNERVLGVDMGIKLLAVDNDGEVFENQKHRGVVNRGPTLHKRTWVCPYCGTYLDRDVNAAWNIRDEGMRRISAT